MSPLCKLVSLLGSKSRGKKCKQGRYEADTLPSLEFVVRECEARIADEKGRIRIPRRIFCLHFRDKRPSLNAFHWRCQEMTGAGEDLHCP